MKITDVRTAEIKGHGYSTYVRIYTDEGVIGNGECIHGGEGCPEMVHALKQEIIGESPLNVDMLFEKMRRGKLFDGAMAGATVTAMTGIEIALWDLAGKALGVPVYQLLGGKFRDTVRLYCDSHAGKDFSPAAYAERAGGGRPRLRRAQVRRRRDAGRLPQRPLELACLNAELDWMVERVAAVREAVGPAVDLAIDMHGRYDIASGIAVARAMEPFGLLWLEEPVPPENVAAMREVSALAGAPLLGRKPLPALGLPRPAGAAGGRLHHARHSQVRRSVGVPQDREHGRGLLRSAGAAQCLRTARHHGLGPRLRLDPQLPGHGVALDRLPGWDDLTLQDQPVIQNGHVVLTDKPGIGLEVNDEVARTFVRPGTEYFGERP